MPQQGPCIALNLRTFYDCNCGIRPKDYFASGSTGEMEKLNLSDEYLLVRFQARDPAPSELANTNTDELQGR